MCSMNTCWMNKWPDSWCPSPSLLTSEEIQVLSALPWTHTPFSSRPQTAGSSSCSAPLPGPPAGSSAVDYAPPANGVGKITVGSQSGRARGSEYFTLRRTPRVPLSFRTSGNIGPLLLDFIGTSHRGLHRREALGGALEGKFPRFSVA